MAIDVGDAILSFLGDTTQLDAAFQRVGAEVPAKMAPAAAAIQATSAATDEMAGRMATGAMGAKELGEVVTLSGEKAQFSMYEARGEAGLLGEMFGIHLPRHVRSFIAELPGVGVALSSAFAATAVLFIVEAIAKGIEKLVEWREEGHKLELAQEGFQTAIAKSFNSLEEKLLRAQVKVDELKGNHLDALQKELEIINLQTLGDLEKQFEVLAKAADEVFKILQTSWFSFDAGSKGAQKELDDFRAKYNLLLAERKPEEAEKLLESFRNQVKAEVDGMEKAAKLAEQVHTTIVHGQAIQEKVGGGPGEKELEARRTLLTVLDAELKDRQEILKTADVEKEAKNLEEAKRVADEQDRIARAQAQAYKQGLEEEDRADDERRRHAIDDIQQQEKEKIAATKQGSQERINAIDAAIKVEEAHGLQDEAFYKSLQVQRVEAVKARVAQEQAAQNKANQEELKNDEQQATRELALSKASANEQEKAIQELGKSKVFSQQEASRRLIALYEADKNKALAVLQTLLSQEKALMERASKDLAAAKLNPGVTPEQIQQAENLLNQLKNAVANTETQIAKTKADANAKELAADRSYYGQALALAVAFGKQELAERLKANHAALLSAKAQLADAKARGLDTHAIEQQIKVLQKLEKELIKDTAQQTKQHSLSLNQFAELSKTLKNYEDELDRSGSKSAAWGAALGGVISEVAQDWAQGGVTIEQALAKIAAAELQAIAQIAEKEGTKQLALAFGSYPDGAAMAHHFAAAGLWFGLAGALSIGSAALSGGGSSSNSPSSVATGGTAAPAAGSPNTVAGTTPSPVINTVHLASGGLVSRPTMAVVGHGPEAVLPLQDHSVMRAIASAISAEMRGGGAQEITIQVHTNLPAAVKEISRGVNAGRMRLLASDSIRHTRRS